MRISQVRGAALGLVACLMAAGCSCAATAVVYVTPSPIVTTSAPPTPSPIIIYITPGPSPTPTGAPTQVGTPTPAVPHTTPTPVVAGPRITLQHTSGAALSENVAYLSGFMAGERIEVRQDNGGIMTCVANRNGSCSISFRVGPKLPYGRHTLAATGTSSGLTASTTFDQNAGILALSPSSVWPGFSVVASVEGYGAGETVAFTLDGVMYGVCTPTFPTQGHCGAKFTIPLDTPLGRYTVTAIGLSSGLRTSVSLAVTPTPTFQV
jgi:hypothetical protein